MDGTHHLHFTGGSIGIAAAGAAGLALTGRLVGMDGWDMMVLPTCDYWGRDPIRGRQG